MFSPPGTRPLRSLTFRPCSVPDTELRAGVYLKTTSPNRSPPTTLITIHMILNLFLVLSCHASSARSQLSTLCLTASARSPKLVILMLPARTRCARSLMRLSCDVKLENVSSCIVISSDNSVVSDWNSSLTARVRLASSLREAIEDWRIATFSRTE
jgi:hypothetical protein